MEDQTAIALPLRLKPEAHVERKLFSAVIRWRCFRKPGAKTKTNYWT